MVNLQQRNMSVSDAEKGFQDGQSSAITRGDKKKESYSIFIAKVLKQVHPNTNIYIMNSFNLLEWIAAKVRELTHYKRLTIAFQGIQMSWAGAESGNKWLSLSSAMNHETMKP